MIAVPTVRAFKTPWSTKNPRIASEVSRINVAGVTRNRAHGLLAASRAGSATKISSLGGSAAKTGSSSLEGSSLAENAGSSTWESSISFGDHGPLVMRITRTTRVGQRFDSVTFVINSQ